MKFKSRKYEQLLQKYDSDSNFIYSGIGTEIRKWAEIMEAIIEGEHRAPTYNEIEAAFNEASPGASGGSCAVMIDFMLKAWKYSRYIVKYVVVSEWKGSMGKGIDWFFHSVIHYAIPVTLRSVCRYLSS